jgi:hypothetical protein
MKLRTVVTVVLTAGMGVVGITTADPASARGDAVGGHGNHYLVAGAGNITGRTAGGSGYTGGYTTSWLSDFRFGDPGDEVFFGDFHDSFGEFSSDQVDDVVVRRGNTFIFRGSRVKQVAFGDPGDVVLVGDWNGDGLDTPAVRRGNTYYVKNNWYSGVADEVFVFGDAGDRVLVGNWDRDSAPDNDYAGCTDTLMVQRGNHFFVKNDLSTGVADYDFFFGDPGDSVLVGDWAIPPEYGDDPSTPALETTHVTPGISGDGVDALAVRRGNAFHQSEDVRAAAEQKGRGLRTSRSFAYGDPSDTAFVAKMPYGYDANGESGWLTGDGLAVRRND